LTIIVRAHLKQRYNNKIKYAQKNYFALRAVAKLGADFFQF